MQNVSGLRTVEWKNNKVVMIEQTKLPNELIFVEYDDFNQVANAIKTLIVRGAPAIGVSGAFGLGLAALQSKATTKEELLFDLEYARKILFATRPTAVNLGWGLEKIMNVAKTGETAEQIRELVISTAKKMADEDIEINVEKGVVYVSISDKLLFRSGSYTVTSRAKEVLGKVATVVNNKPELEFMVEGHTDNVPIKIDGIVDNWDLSVKRATAVVRILEKDFGVAPARMTAAGRSFYITIADNDTAANRAKNRRTRIVVLPKLDQFYDLIEQGMQAAK